MRPPPIALVLPLLAAGLVLLAGCGDEAPGLDRSSPQAVYEATMAAAYDGDWPALEQLLTKDARFTLERELGRIRTNLANPRPGSRLVPIVKDQLGDAYEAELATALDGGMPAMLRFWRKVSPRERVPKTQGVRVLPQTQGMEFLYTLGTGKQVGVRLTQQGGRWYVSLLPI